MEKRMCECPRCQQKYRDPLFFPFKLGDSINVYSAGYLQQNGGIFLEKQGAFIQWLDNMNNIHFTHTNKIHMQKLTSY
ncbi:hypothetical protein II5_05901 [Bacillus cereus MSX-A1]|nr:hypothetical protein II5_05901 [Bacillus cereus MSX-A1]